VPVLALLRGFAGVSGYAVAWRRGARLGWRVPS
jgi:hypothetical protein